MAATLYSGHKAKVNIARFSPNGEWVASGDDYGNVHVWGSWTKVLKNETVACRKVLDISWSPDGKRVAACGDGSEQLAKVFPWDSGSNLGRITGHSKVILSIAYRPTRPFRIFTSSEDKAINFYEGPPFKYKASYKGHTRYPNQIKFSPDGSRAVACGADGKISVFEGKDGQKVGEFNAHDKANILCFCWSPDGKEILTGSSDKTCRIYNVDDGSEVAKFEKFSEHGAVGDQQVSTFWCESAMGSVSLDGTINFFDRASTSISRRWFGHQDHLSAVAIDRTNRKVFSGCQGGRVCEWDEKTSEVTPFLGHGPGKQVAGLGLSACGAKLIVVSYDDTLRVCDLAAKRFGDGVALGSQAAGLAVSKSTPGLAAVVLHQNKLLIFKFSELVGSVDLPFRPTSVAISPDDKEIAIGSHEAGERAGLELGTVYLYSLSGSSATQSKKLPTHEHPITSVVYSDDGANLLSTDVNRYIYVWDRSGSYDKPRQTGWRYHSAKPTCSAWAPDNEKAVTGSMDQSLLVWKKASAGKSRRAELEPTHLGGVSGVQWMDDETLVTIGDDKCVKVWPYHP